MPSCRYSEGEPVSWSCNKRGRRVGIIVLIPLFFSLSMTLGCVDVRAPMKPGDDNAVPHDEGLVLGRLHVAGKGGDLQGSTEQPLRVPFHIQWRLEEQLSGKTFLIEDLPSDGPFVLRLPVGSYRLTHLSFDTSLGAWQASTLDSFSVSPRECSYLGTWRLRMEAGFFDGSISRQVLDQHELAERELNVLLNKRSSTPMRTQLSAAMKRPLILTFRTQGTELTSPP